MKVNKMNKTNKTLLGIGFVFAAMLMLFITGCTQTVNPTNQPITGAAAPVGTQPGIANPTPATPTPADSGAGAQPGTPSPGTTTQPGAANPGTPTQTPTPPPTPTPAPPVVNIQISNFKFDPGTVTIKAGTKVTWTQQDSVTHTVESDTGLFISPDLSKGDTYSFTFTTPGTYTYHCSIHPGMTGTIIVN